MSPSEHQELVEFLTGQFARADRRFPRRSHELTLELSRRLTAIADQIASFRAGGGAAPGRFRPLRRDLPDAGAAGAGILRYLQQLRRIEGAVTDDRQRGDVLERELEALRERVAALQARLDDIDRRLGA